MQIPFYVLAQAEAAPSMWGAMVPMLAIFAIFYFLLIWPVRKRQKALQKLVEELKRGDKVVTNGGIYGEIAAIEGSLVYLKISDNTKIKISKSAIAGLEGDGEPGGSKS